MKEKIIQQNEHSKTSVAYDGEIVILTQSSVGIGTGSVHLYLDEFEEAYEYIKKQVKQNN